MKSVSVLLLMVCVLLNLPSLPAEESSTDGPDGLAYQATVRAFLIDDQRIQWSGVENSFSAEAVLQLNYHRHLAGLNLQVQTEVLISQPFNRNILSDEYRIRYRQNFDIDPVSFKQLFIGVEAASFTLKLGKFVSPFGRSHVPSLCNAYIDQPFIRAESIMRWDTGLAVSLTPGPFSLDLALVNGSEDQDTNSAKALIGRVGLGGQNWAIGLSGKYFGDQGSETQKMYSDHLGVDLMVRLGRLTLSGELIHDRYGLHRPLSEAEVTWPRSYYYRDIHRAFKTAITGTGGYVNLNWQGSSVSVNLNYGEFHPVQIGQPLHDEMNRRLLASLTIRFFEGLQLFVSTLFENDRPREPVFSGASPYMYMLGLQFRIQRRE